jgi:hypothetical protein
MLLKYPYWNIPAKPEEARTSKSSNCLAFLNLHVLLLKLYLDNIVVLLVVF